MPGYTAWKTLTLGCGKQLPETIDDFGIHVTGPAWKLLTRRRFPILTREQEVNLVPVHVSDLGLRHVRTSTENIYRMAHGIGLNLCPAEVAPRLCLDMFPRPKTLIQKESINGRLVVAMQPISGWVFVLDGLNCSLDAWECFATRLWYPNDVFLFVLNES